jgi:2-amino-4-hydroxy-6-hydroxymethyldihydropteridine diphosphokinase
MTATSRTAATSTAYIGLGANLGDAAAAVRAAASAIGALPGTRLLALSGLYRSAPVGAAGPDFINAVAQVQTRLAPLDLLAALQALESAAGRERPYPNAPRTLDLDILLYGNVACHTPTLTLPHPRLHLRRFVLWPLSELAPQLQIPSLANLPTLLAAVADQAVQRIDA